MVELGIGRGKDEVHDKTLIDSDDTEITLGTGKLLGIFFGLVFVCAIFFTLGYLLGHSTAAGDKTEIVGAAPANGSPAGKPSAVNKNGAPQATVGPAPSNDAAATQAPASVVPASSAVPATDIKASPGGTYTVQVAAVSKKEDADNLVTALSKKQYPVFMTTIAGDTLFHVQVGPFSDPKDAETMRVKLAGEGYDAIVKK
jgi:cell division septation protein DedD